MSTLDDFLDSPSSDLDTSLLDSSGLLDGRTETNAGVSWSEPGYEGQIDYRIRQLSYSSILSLHTCPRKFQLYKLRTTNRLEETEKSRVTFSFGGIVGQAIQSTLEGKSWNTIAMEMLLGWKTDLFSEDPKLKKSFFSAYFAAKKFQAMLKAGLLKDYELVYYEGKPACELSFCINLPDGFRFRGYVDAVLRNISTGEIIVLEVKTTGLKALEPAMYKNSSQAIGYSIVLDHLFPDLSSYKVLYLVYQTSNEEFTPIPFAKSYLQRAQWIRELLLEVDKIKMYEEAQIYPMHGESCFSFFRECEYINSCTLSTEHLTKPCSPEMEDKEEYQISISLLDLLDTQLRKVGS